MSALVETPSCRESVLYWYHCGLRWRMTVSLTAGEIEEGGHGLGGGAEEDVVEGGGVGGFFGANVDGAGGSLARDVDEASGGIDGAGGSDDEEDGGSVELGVD